MQALPLPYSRSLGSPPIVYGGTKREVYVHVSREHWRAADAVLLLAWVDPWTPAQALERSTRSKPASTNGATVAVDVRYGESSLGTLWVALGAPARQELSTHSGGLLRPDGFSYTVSAAGERFDTLEVAVWLALRQPTDAERAARELFGESLAATSVGASLGSVQALRRALSE